MSPSVSTRLTLVASKCLRPTNASGKPTQPCAGVRGTEAYGLSV
jgi:hypothetical protein